MSFIYHLVPRSVWNSAASQPYTADSLASEGFIHCSFAEQVARSANRFHAATDDLLVLHIDPDRLTSALRVEASGSGERFPHVYGPINHDAVIAAQPLQRDAGGKWTFAGS